MAIVRIVIQIKDDVLPVREKVNLHIVVSIQPICNIAVLRKRCLKMIPRKHIIPEQNAVGWEENDKPGIRIFLNIRTDIYRKIFLRTRDILISRHLFLHHFRPYIIVEHPVLAVIFLRPPALVNRGEICGIRIRQRPQNIIEQYILVQHILNVVYIIIVIKVFRNGILCFLHAAHVGDHIHTQKDFLYLMVTVKNNLHDIGLILGISAAVA